MLNKNVFSPVMVNDLPVEEQRNIIPSFIFLKQKFNPNGEPGKVKADLLREEIIKTSLKDWTNFFAFK
jgi:hypothetical protein